MFRTKIYASPENVTGCDGCQLGSWNLKRMFTPHCVSYVMCHMSYVTCHVSSFTIIFYLFLKCWRFLVEGLLSTGPTSSSFYYRVRLTCGPKCPPPLPYQPILESLIIFYLKFIEGFNSLRGTFALIIRLHWHWTNISSKLSIELSY